MRIAMIAAMAKDRVIGKDNQMPWYLPADLQHFKRVTLGKPVIMGRKTYESIGKALPGRRNIVISRDENYHLDDAEVVKSPEQALSAAGSVEEVMIIGGGAIYQAFLPHCERLYLTHIHADIPGDTRFPDYRVSGAGWQEIAQEVHPADEKNPYRMTFSTLQRV